MSINFANNKRSELVELQRDLHNPKLEKRIDALKKVTHSIYIIS